MTQGSAGSEAAGASSNTHSCSVHHCGLSIHRRQWLLLPTITTRHGLRRGAAKRGTRKCPLRAEALRPAPMGEVMACTAPHTRPRVVATTRPRSTTVSRVGPDASRLLATPEGLSMAPKPNDGRATYLEAEPTRWTAVRLSARAATRSRSSQPTPPPSHPPTALPSLK